jgi:flagellar FliL protein
MADKAADKQGMGGVIIAGVVVSLIAAGGGAGLGFMLPITAPAPELKQETAATEDAKPEAEKPEHAPTVVHPLPPIVTNLASPSNAWIRLEASLLIDSAAKDEVEALSAKASNDIMAFLRTVTLSQIEGASGYQHFRQDLLDLVTTVTEGKVKEISIASMVVE